MNSPLITNSPFWPGTPLSELAAEDRGIFYDALADDDIGDQLFGGGKKANLYESQAFRIGIVDDKSRVVPAAGFKHPKPLSNARINVFLEGFFAAAMPGRKFRLQLLIGATHRFDEGLAQDIGHTVAVDGVLEDYVGVLGDPCFWKLKIDETLTLHVSINFVADKSDESVLRLLDSDQVKKGVELTATYNPVFGATLAYARGIAQALLKSRQNQSIIKCTVGFRTDPGDIGIPLAESTYVLVQVPSPELNTFSWDNTQWHSASGRIVRDGQPLMFNHLLLRLESA